MLVSNINYHKLSQPQKTSTSPIKQNNLHFAGNNAQQINLNNLPNNAYAQANILTNIHFGSRNPSDSHNRTIQDIDYNTYKNLKPYKIEFYEKRCNNFDKVLQANESNLYDKKYASLPLKTDFTMNEFIKTAQIYTKFKDQPIISVGRSPKWFLDAASWMKDGIDPKNYKFVAFSKYWYLPDKTEGMVRKDNLAPTKEEITAYRKYLKRAKADPKTIVDNFEKTGKKTVLTDYISTGKGVTSFLEVMSNYADDMGILEKFSKSIQIVGIGSMEYLEKFHYEDEEISTPEVIMPEKLKKYKNNIKQEYHDLSYPMFEQMLLNQNTNECRSSYYPHQAWTVYQPDRFKTGLIKDFNKVDKLAEQHQMPHKTFNNFRAEMGDFRNYLRFRILNGLQKRHLLK